MKAAVLHEFKKPLTFEDVPRPEPGPGDVLIEVKTCGVCHSDLHLADGDWTQLADMVKKPLILGHELVGCVVEKGSAVQSLQLGDRVGVPWVHWTCGECEFCREGNENLCMKQSITGVTVDGGYAEFATAPATHTTRIPPNLSDDEAAPLFCAGVTVYRALKRAKLRSGQRLAVFGIGGLGHIAIQVGNGLGAEVTAIDISNEKLALANSLGASRSLNAASPSAAKELRDKGGFHVAIVTSAAKEAYEMAFYSLRPTGALLVVGLPADSISFPPILMAAGEVHVQATAVGTRDDLREVLAMAAAGKVRCQVTRRPLAQVNEVLNELRHGRIVGRVVLAPHSS